ncbi:hypothetical protein M885DRAFT_626881 [Pelagophyceae sp. CCMP2097]|nr:hypothetical protein M885DRAFT_626881 [Pelagophyceae sp. CCMP2097]
MYRSCRGTAISPHFPTERRSCHRAMPSPPLPPHCEERFTAQGQRFYVDHLTKQTSWAPPADSPRTSAREAARAGTWAGKPPRHDLALPAAPVAAAGANDHARAHGRDARLPAAVAPAPPGARAPPPRSAAAAATGAPDEAAAFQERVRQRAAVIDRMIRAYATDFTPGVVAVEAPAPRPQRTIWEHVYFDLPDGAPRDQHVVFNPRRGRTRGASFGSFGGPGS